MTKQAAGKTIARMEELGYAERIADDVDGRRKIVRPTAHGRDLLARSSEVDGVRRRWVRALDAKRVGELEHDLKAMVPRAVFRLDLPGWLG